MKRRPLFFALLLLLVAVPALAADSWQEFRSFEGGFAVQLPGPPKVTADPPDANGVSSHSFLVDRDKTAYMVGYDQYPAGKLAVLDPVRVLDVSRDDLIKGREVTLTEDRPLKLEGHPGRELVFVAKDGFTQMVRLYVVGDRLYQTLSGGPKGHEKTPEAKRFHDSFHLIRTK